MEKDKKKKKSKKKKEVGKVKARTVTHARELEI